MTYRVEPLGDHHELDAFDCGNEELNTWLKQHARRAVGQGTRTFVLVEGRLGAVRGYFALVPHMVERDVMPSRVRRGAPRHIPAILLAKLALDRTVQGVGLGSDLLVHALRMILEAAKIAGGRIVVVDAIDDEARRFYEHHDFVPAPGNDARLVLKLSTAAKALGVRWP